MTQQANQPTEPESLTKGSNLLIKGRVWKVMIFSATEIGAYDDTNHWEFIPLMEAYTYWKAYQDKYSKK